MNNTPPPGSPAASSRAVFPTTPGTDRPRLGSQFVPRQRIYMDADSVYLQRCILSMQRHHKTGRQLSNIGAAVCGLGLAAALLLAMYSCGGV